MERRNYRISRATDIALTKRCGTGNTGKEEPASGHREADFAAHARTQARWHARMHACTHAHMNARTQERKKEKQRENTNDQITESGSSIASDKISAINFNEKTTFDFTRGRLTIDGGVDHVQHIYGSWEKSRDTVGVFVISLSVLNLNLVNEVKPLAMCLEQRVKSPVPNIVTTSQVLTPEREWMWKDLSLKLSIWNKIAGEYGSSMGLKNLKDGSIYLESSCDEKKQKLSIKKKANRLYGFYCYIIKRKKKRNRESALAASPTQSYTHYDEHACLNAVYFQCEEKVRTWAPFKILNRAQFRGADADVASALLLDFFGRDEFVNGALAEYLHRTSSVLYVVLGDNVL
ncbi:hypothetical protein EVAR_23551_1 [Eumeta japonica]|uniref:Uncharacterized protein n=1 Tax=Eumeta variegata TaxID=151549 RepID=A0A4C1WWL8_EUMVA|nr:hypothetical protein EVAR_23551_1 [Eumeta japonica]